MVVTDAVEGLWPRRFTPQQLRDDVSLGEGGLGLDSIDIVELVLECEQRAGRAEKRAEEIFEGGPVTVGRLIDHLASP